MAMRQFELLCPLLSETLPVHLQVVLSHNLKIKIIYYLY